MSQNLMRLGRMQFRFLDDTPENWECFTCGTEAMNTIVVYMHDLKCNPEGDADKDCTHELRVHRGCQKKGGYPLFDLAAEGGEGPTAEEILQEICDDPVLLAQLQAKAVQLTGPELCALVLEALTADPAKVLEWQALIDTDTDTDTDTNNAVALNATGTGFIVTDPLDASEVEILFPVPPAPTDPETDGVHFSGDPVLDLVAGTITYPTVNDLDESPAAPVVLDISTLITLLTSTPHNELVAGDGITVAEVANPDGSSTFTISSTVVDTTIPDTDTRTVCTYVAVGDNGRVEKTIEVINALDNTVISTDTVQFGGSTVLRQEPGGVTLDRDCIQPTLRDCVGALLAKNAQVINTLDNPLTPVRVRCLAGSVEYTFCDGTTLNANPRKFRRNAQSAGGYVVTGADVPGTVVQSFPPQDQPAPVCPAPMDLEGNIGAIVRTANGGEVNLIMQFSIDGGVTWANMASAGALAINASSVSGEFSHNWSNISPAVSGTSPIEFRVITGINTLAAGSEIVMGSSNAYSVTERMICC